MLKSSIPTAQRPLSLDEARTAQSLRLERAGFYQIHFANGRDAVIGVNPDRRESDLAPMPADVLAAMERQFAELRQRAANAASPAKRHDPVRKSVVVRYAAWHCWSAVAETALASRYLGTQREEA